MGGCKDPTNNPISNYIKGLGRREGDERGRGKERQNVSGRRGRDRERGKPARGQLGKERIDTREREREQKRELKRKRERKRKHRKDSILWGQFRLQQQHQQQQR